MQIVFLVLDNGRLVGEGTHEELALRTPCIKKFTKTQKRKGGSLMTDLIKASKFFSIII